MKLQKLPIGTLDEVAELLEDNSWIMLVTYRTEQELQQAQQLIGESALYEEYSWLRVPASDPAGLVLLDTLSIEQVPSFAVVSMGKEEPEVRIFDEWEDCFPEDLIEFMEEHAAEAQQDD